MASYDWRNPKTGKVVTTDDPTTPPKKGWVRVFSFGIGSSIASPTRVAPTKQNK